MEKEIKTFEVTVKEKMMDNPIITSYTGRADKEDVIDFYGLNEPDVEWYRIVEVNNI